MSDSAFGRLIGAFVNPRATFESIALRPTWLLPIVVAMVASLAMTSVLVPKLDFEAATREQIENSGANLSAEEVEQQVAMATKFGSVAAWVSPVLLTPLMYVVLALLFWGATAALGGSTSFKKSLAVAGHGMLPQVLVSLLSIPVVLSRANIDAAQAQAGFLASHLGVLVDATTSPLLFALLASVDVFSIWTAILLAIGLRVVGKLSAGAAALAVGAPWVLWIAIKVGLAALPLLMKAG